MLLKIRSCFIVLGAVMILFILTACKFDRSKIAMPKMKFITGENLHKVVCFDDRHLWIFGNHGTVYFSGDEGTTWNKQETGVEVLLGDASFVSKDEGWAVGVAGTVLHTADGGKTWKPQRSGTERDLLNVFFLDNQKGWAVGEYGTLIHTPDGGITWAPQMGPTDKNYNNVYFVDQNSGWVVGEFGTILHTEDGGKSWSPQECKDIAPVITAKEWERPLPALYRIFFIDKSQGWITGMDGVIIRTVDGGKNWNKVPSNTDKPIYGILVKGNRGWAVGNKG
ncbi:MAG: YCF48-related protein, partial [Proteobacteria bacterium]|nr:YCF48-related protein [Pseudomonadota bacterium]